MKTFSEWLREKELNEAKLNADEIVRLVLKDPNINIENIKAEIDGKFIPDKQMAQVEYVLSTYKKYKDSDKQIKKLLSDKNTKKLRDIYSEMFDDIEEKITRILYNGFSVSTEGTKILLNKKSDFIKIVKYLVGNVELLDRISGKELNEAKVEKPYFGLNDTKNKNYAVQINGIENDFPSKPFGQQIDAMKKLKEFKTNSKSTRVDAKGKATMSAVKEWVKENKPSEFFASWEKDSSSYKDDSVEIFFK